MSRVRAILAVLNRCSNQTIHQVVRRPEHTPVTRSMDDLLNDGVSVQVQVVHGKNCVRNSRSNIMQDHQNNKCEVFCGRCSSVMPHVNPSPRRASRLVVLSVYCCENIQFFTVSARTNFSHTPCETCLARATVSKFNE